MKTFFADIVLQLNLWYRNWWSPAKEIYVELSWILYLVILVHLGQFLTFWIYYLMTNRAWVCGKNNNHGVLRKQLQTKHVTF